jgi:hypothetical protein
MTQHNIKKGIELFGEKDIDAVLKELKPLHDRDVMEPKELTHEEKRAAVHYLMFPKKKQLGTIKGRGCADGRK